MSPRQGNDVSFYQGDIDWVEYAEENQFAFVSIGDGSVKDPLATPARIKAIRAAKLKYGFGLYYYGRVAAESNHFRNAAAECHMVLERALATGWGQRGVDLRLAYDFEEANGRPANIAAAHLVDFIRAHRERMGHKPIVYGPYSFLASLNRSFTPGQRALVKGCPLWIADLEGKVDVPPPWIGGKDFAIHQDTFTDHSKGIRGIADHDLAGPEFDRLRLPK